MLDALVDEVLRATRPRALARLRELPAGAGAPGRAAAGRRRRRRAGVRGGPPRGRDPGAGRARDRAARPRRRASSRSPSTACCGSRPRLAVDQHAPEPVRPGDPGQRRSFGEQRGHAASSDRRRASPACSTARRSATICWSASWRPGDRMAPLGLQRLKSLQDLFTARRVPRRERGGVPVVESGGEIVWVAGVATSERFKVTDSHERRRFAAQALRDRGTAPPSRLIR